MRKFTILASLFLVACAGNEPEDSTVEADADTDADSDTDTDTDADADSDSDSDSDADADADSDADADADSDADTDPTGWSGEIRMDAEAGGGSDFCVGTVTGALGESTVALDFNCTWDGPFGDHMGDFGDGTIDGTVDGSDASGTVNWGFLEGEPWTGSATETTLDGSFSGQFTGGEADITYTGTFSASAQ